MSYFCQYLENYIRLIELGVARFEFIPTFPHDKSIFGAKSHFGDFLLAIRIRNYQWSKTTDQFRIYIDRIF